MIAAGEHSASGLEFDRGRLDAFIDQYDLSPFDGRPDQIELSEINSIFISDFISGFLPEGRSVDVSTVHRCAAYISNYLDLGAALEFTYGLFNSCHAGFQSILCRDGENQEAEQLPTMPVQQTEFNTQILDAISGISLVDPEVGRRLENLYLEERIRYGEGFGPAEAYTHPNGTIILTENVRLCQDIGNETSVAGGGSSSGVGYQFSNLESYLQNNDSVNRGDLFGRVMRSYYERYSFLPGCRPNHAESLLVHEESHLREFDPADPLNIYGAVSRYRDYNYALSTTIYKNLWFNQDELRELRPRFAAEGLSFPAALAIVQMERETEEIVEDYIMTFCALRVYGLVESDFCRDW